MKWIEIIEVRVADRNRNLLEEQFKRIIKELDSDTEKKTFKAYYNVIVESDMSIHLHHDSNHIKINGSALGLRLVSIFKDFGMVHHSIWFEMKSK